MKKLKVSFYARKDVVVIAKDLIGKILVTNINGGQTSGRIVETEAYNGVIDKASHAFGGRYTDRTKVMYMPGGHAYVYLCYGIHHLFNVVTNVQDTPHAVLIRAVEPICGIDIMLQRTGKKKLDHTLTRGPGNVSKALGIQTLHSAESLFGNTIYIVNDGFKIADQDIGVTSRVGVNYAGEDAQLPYRFYIKNNLFVSALPRSR